MRFPVHDSARSCREPREKSQAGAHFEVHVPELCKVGAHDLVGVHKNDLAQGQRKQNVQEQDLVGPDDALLLRLQWRSTAGISDVSSLLHAPKLNLMAGVQRSINNIAVKVWNKRATH